jgi:hypothetical protein
MQNLSENQKSICKLYTPHFADELEGTVAKTAATVTVTAATVGPRPFGLRLAPEPTQALPGSQCSRLGGAVSDLCPRDDDRSTNLANAQLTLAKSSPTLSHAVTVPGQAPGPGPTRSGSEFSKFFRVLATGKFVPRCRCDVSDHDPTPLGSNGSPWRLTASASVIA